MGDDSAGEDDVNARKRNHDKMSHVEKGHDADEIANQASGTSTVVYIQIHGTQMND